MSRKPDPVVVTAITALMTGLVLAVTFVVSIPISAVGQGFDGGDIMIFIAAWAFGPVVGGIAGGVRSAVSDALMPGAAVFAPFRLVLNGSEGFAAGVLAGRYPASLRLSSIRR